MKFGILLNNNIKATNKIQLYAKNPLRRFILYSKEKRQCAAVDFERIHFNQNNTLGILDEFNIAWIVLFQNTKYKSRFYEMDDRIRSLEKEIEHLSSTLAAKKEELSNLRNNKDKSNPNSTQHLTNEEISRFSRQLILPEIGVKGQIKLRNAKVLIVGAGGLGKRHRYITNLKLIFILIKYLII